MILAQLTELPASSMLVLAVSGGIGHVWMKAFSCCVNKPMLFLCTGHWPMVTLLTKSAAVQVG